MSQSDCVCTAFKLWVKSFFLSFGFSSNFLLFAFISVFFLVLAFPRVQSVHKEREREGFKKSALSAADEDLKSKERKNEQKQERKEMHQLSFSAFSLRLNFPHF